MQIIDPIRLLGLCWPHVKLTRYQRDIVYSVRDNDETISPAGNELGKDFVAAFIVLWFFVSRSPARIVTTSVQEKQLEDVLWGQIKWFIDGSKYTLPLLYNHLLIRRLRNDGTVVPMAEIRGQVTRQGEALLGRHWPRGPNGEPTTLAVFDEASAIADTTYTSTDTWAHRKLIIGNPFPCSNFFYRGVKAAPPQGGDLLAPCGTRYYRKVLPIKAEESPNVQRGLLQKERGIEPDNLSLVPGVLTYDDYCKRRQLWDPIMQCIGLDGDFYEGAELMMFPPLWLNRAVQLGRSGAPPKPVRATLGVDSAEGGDNTAFAVVDRWGLRHLSSLKTPDTSVITGHTLGLAKRFGVKGHNILFDAGGGGKQHADRLRRNGHNVRAIAFGASATTQPVPAVANTPEHKDEVVERRYVYRNRRAEIYGLVRLALDPAEPGQLALPPKWLDAPRQDGGPSLRNQLAPIPLKYDDEGRLFLLPKTKRDARDKRITLVDLIGCSPDEADALGLAVYGQYRRPVELVVGAVSLDE